MKEYADFLADQAPYDTLTADELLSLVSQAQVEYFPAGSIVIEVGSPVPDHMWVIRTGSMSVLDRSRVIDQLGPGDTFGHISMMSHSPPVLTVRADEDSLCLRLPDPRTVFPDPSRLTFSFPGALVGRQRLTVAAVVDRRARPVRELMRPIVWARADEPISVVAARISDHAHSCALVHRGQDIGIVTDRDFRERVASGELAPPSPVEHLATFPALTVSDQFSQAAAFARMVDLGVHHLVVLDRTGRPVGVLRVIDFASTEIRNPLLIRSAVEGADSLESLAESCTLLYPSLVELADHGVPSLQIGNLLAAVVDAILRKLIALQAAGTAGEPLSPLVEMSWVILGSMARREPLPHSDVDTALVWQGNPADAAHGRSRSVLDYASALLEDMKRCGLQPCADGANASNRLFNRSQEGWSRAATQWLSEPDSHSALLMSSIIIDSRPLTAVTLGQTMTDRLRRSPRNPLFLHAFLKEALAVRPPVGFVREFVVDYTGSHRGQLDLKRGGLRPIVGLGRFAAAATGDSRGSTIDRLHRGADAAVLTRDETDTLIGAFDSVYDLLLKRDIAALAGAVAPTRFIDPKTLDSLTRRHLRETFRAISVVQNSVETRWLSQLRD